MTVQPALILILMIQIIVIVNNIHNSNKNPLGVIIRLKDFYLCISNCYTFLCQCYGFCKKV